MKLDKNKEYFSKSNKTGLQVHKELDDGLKMLDKIDKPIITIFGSARVKKNSIYYKQAKDLGALLGNNGYAVMTGGGPGIMEACNVGAKTVGAYSIGIQESLLTGEQVSHASFTHKKAFKYLFVRRFILSIKSEAMVFLPGGFGTLNELFEFIVLMQTKISDTVPVILVNKAYWSGLFEWSKNTLLKEKMINSQNLGLLKIVDTNEEVLQIISKNI